MQSDGEFADEPEVSALSKVANCTINVIKETENNQTIHCVYKCVAPIKEVNLFLNAFALD